MTAPSDPGRDSLRELYECVGADIKRLHPEVTGERALNLSTSLYALVKQIALAEAERIAEEKVQKMWDQLNEHVFPAWRAALESRPPERPAADPANERPAGIVNNPMPAPVAAGAGEPSLLEVVQFLTGAKPMLGYWYGAVPPSGKPYWWRLHLRKAADAVLPKREVEEAVDDFAKATQIASLREAVAWWRGRLGLAPKGEG